MARKTLETIYRQHAGKVADKWALYLREYDRVFQQFRHRPIRLLEIGIQNGGSLEIWPYYFINAQKIVGCDADPRCSTLSYVDPRISVVVGDATAAETEVQITRHSAEYDIVIDDGSHISRDIVKSFARYFPRLSLGGIYAIEDLHCSYWEEYGGGLFDPFSSIAFLKRLADVINFEHWGIGGERTKVLRGVCEKFRINVTEEVLATIHSIEFVNSLCFIRKGSPTNNRLGSRVAVGRLELVADGHRAIDSTESIAPSQAQNKWSDRDMSLEEAAASLNEALEAKDGEIARLKSAVGARDAELAAAIRTVIETEDRIQAIYASRSWRVVAPLRAIASQVRHLQAYVERSIRGTPSRNGSSTVGGTGKTVMAYIGEGFRDDLAHSQTPINQKEYSEWIRRYDTPDAACIKAMQRKIERFPSRPSFSVLVLQGINHQESMCRMVASLRAQLYPHWELCIMADHEARRCLERCGIDERIKLVDFSGNESAVRANSALAMSAGTWVVLLNEAVVLSPYALFWMADAVNRQQDIALMYGDEDALTRCGQRSDPHFKTAWNYDLFLSRNFIDSVVAIKASMVRKCEGFRDGFGQAMGDDLILRCIERLTNAEIFHIPRVVNHRLNQANKVGGASHHVTKALREHFARRGLSCTPELQPDGEVFRIRYELPAVTPMVSIIIPTRNGLHVLRKCVASVQEKTEYSNYEVLIVDNGSDDASTLKYLEEVTNQSRLRVLRDNRPFNFSAINNAAAKQGSGDYVLFLNNDTEVISPDWLTEMVGIASQPGVGAVGARLWYPNDTLQHGGVILGLGGVAGHIHCGLRRGDKGYAGRAVAQQALSAVTGACLLVRRALFNKVGGFDENLEVAFNDVDLCLRIMEMGYRNVWTPYAELYHHESVSRGAEDSRSKQLRFRQEVEYMKRRWGDKLLNDDAYNPNLTLFQPGFALAWPPRVERLSEC